MKLRRKLTLNCHGRLRASVLPSFDGKRQRDRERKPREQRRKRKKERERKRESPVSNLRMVRWCACSVRRRSSVRGRPFQKETKRLRLANILRHLGLMIFKERPFKFFIKSKIIAQCGSDTQPDVINILHRILLLGAKESWKPNAT